MSGSGSMPTKPVPAPRRGRKPKEPSVSDNCRMCGCVSNVFVACTRIGETLPKFRGNQQLFPPKCIENTF